MKSAQSIELTLEAQVQHEINTADVSRAIADEHRFATVRQGIEVVAMICDGMDPEAVEQLCDLVDVRGTAEVRRYVANWRKLTSTVVRMEPRRG